VPALNAVSAFGQVHPVRYSKPQHVHTSMPSQNIFGVVPNILSPLSRCRPQELAKRPCARGDAQNQHHAIRPDSVGILNALSTLEDALIGLGQDVKKKDDVPTPTTTVACSTPEWSTSSITPPSFPTPPPGDNLTVDADDIMWLNTQIDNAAKNRALCERQRERFAELRRMAHEEFEDVEQGEELWPSGTQRREILQLEHLLAECRDMQKGAEEKLASGHLYAQGLLGQTEALNAELAELRESKTSISREKDSLDVRNRKLEVDIGEAELQKEQLRQQYSDLERSALELQKMTAHAQASMIRSEEKASTHEAEAAALALQLQVLENLAEKDQKPFKDKHIADERCVVELTLKQERIDFQSQRIFELEREVACLQLERGNLLELQKADRQRIEQLEKENASNALCQDSIRNTLRRLGRIEKEAVTTSESQGDMRSALWNLEAPLEDQISSERKSYNITVEDRAASAGVSVSFTTPEKTSPRKTVCHVPCIDISTIPRAHVEVLEKLEKHGWGSIEWKRGFTLLHWAASKGHVDLCRHLIDLNGDPGQLDDLIRTPVDLAHRNGHQHVVKVLQQCASSW